MTPAFLDILEWAADTDYDYAINVETDLTFIRPCFSSFVAGLMADADYMAFGYRILQLIISVTKTLKIYFLRKLLP